MSTLPYSYVIARELYTGDYGVDAQRVFNKWSAFSYAHGIGLMARKDAKMVRGNASSHYRTTECFEVE